MKYLAELYKDNKHIGDVFIVDDEYGGGLNGGIFFRGIDSNILERDIPLFDKYK